MSDLLLVTGGTGLTGSTVALLAARQGRAVRALVRSRDGVDPLTAAGVEVRVGDVTRPDTLDDAMAGVSQVINTAAVLSGTWLRATPEEMWAVNHDGALNVLDAAARAGVSRCLHIDSNSIWDTAATLTERSPLIPVTELDSPYVAAKRAAYAGALHRAMRGQDIVFVTPGAIYGPGVFADRALDPTCFTRTALRGIRGELDTYLAFPMMWTYVADLAEIVLRALDHGQVGQRYLALGRLEDVSSLAGYCNQAAELAGSSHRVRDVGPTDPDAPAIGTMRQFAERPYATPLFDDTRTVSALGYGSTPRAEALAVTVAWLRAQESICEEPG